MEVTRCCNPCKRVTEFRREDFMSLSMSMTVPPGENGYHKASTRNRMYKPMLVNRFSGESSGGVEMEETPVFTRKAVSICRSASSASPSTNGRGYRDAYPTTTTSESL